MHLLYRSILILLCFSVLASCVQRNDLDTLELRVYEQEQQIKKLNDRLGQTTKELEASRPEQADMWSDVQSMRNRMAAIDAMLEDIQQRSMMQEDRQAEQTRMMESLQNATTYLDASMRIMASQMAIELPVYRPAALAQTATIVGSSNATAEPVVGQVSATANKAEDTPPPPADQNGTTLVAADGTVLVVNPGKAPEPAVTEQSLYDAAYKAFMERRYKDALRMWEQFEKIYPKHSLVANAVFWQGETNYQLKEYGPAVLAYQRVIDTYSKSDKYRSAMLKQGISFGKLGKKTAAKVRLEELIKKFPKSPEADRAKKALKEIQ